MQLPNTKFYISPQLFNPLPRHTHTHTHTHIHTYFGDNLKKTTPTHQGVGAPTNTLKQAKQQPTPTFILPNTTEHIKNILGDFSYDGSDFDAADGNSYKDYYSDDDDLFPLVDVSHSELRDIKRAWNAQTSAQEALIPTEIITGNGTKSSNSAKSKEDLEMNKLNESPHQLILNHTQY